MRKLSPFFILIVSLISLTLISPASASSFTIENFSGNSSGSDTCIDVGNARIKNCYFADSFDTNLNSWLVGSTTNGGASVENGQMKIANTGIKAYGYLMHNQETKTYPNSTIFFDMNITAGGGTVGWIYHNFRGFGGGTNVSYQVRYFVVNSSQLRDNVNIASVDFNGADETLIQRNRTYHMKIEANYSSLNVYKDGISILNGTNANHTTSGNFSLASGYDADSIAYYDNVRVAGINQTTGNRTVFHDFGTNRRGKTVSLNGTSDANLNINILASDNTTIQANAVSGTIYSIPSGYRTQNQTIRLMLVGNTSNSPELINVTINDEAIEFMPSTPISVSDSVGNFWINHTWTNGTGNVTDSYNYTVNGLWTNGSSNTYNNTTLSPHGWSNISVYAYNSTTNGTLNSTAMSVNTRIPNNHIIISNISHTYTLSAGSLLEIFPNYTDADSDIPTWSNNTDNKGTFNTSSGNFSYTAQSGVWNWNVTASDGYGSIYTKNFTVSVDSVVPGQPLNLVSTQLNYGFWINNTWTQSVNTDSFNITQNGTWSNGTTANFFNVTVPAHRWSNISIFGFNATGGLGNGSSLNTQLANNAPVITNASLSASSITLGQSITISVNVTDADSDTLTNSVGIVATSLGGSEVNYSMTTINNITYNYIYIPSTTATYTITHFYSSDNYINVSNTSALTITVSAATASVISGGGGGGSSIIVQPTTTVTPLSISIANITGGRTKLELDAITKCLKDEFFLSSACSANALVIIGNTQNYWILGGIFFGSLFAVWTSSLIIIRRNRALILDSVLSAIITGITILFFNMIDFNTLFIGNYILNSELLGATFAGMFVWGMTGAILLQEIIMPKPKIYNTTRRIRL